VLTLVLPPSAPGATVVLSGDIRPRHAAATAARPSWHIGIRPGIQGRRFRGAASHGPL